MPESSILGLMEGLLEIVGASIGFSVGYIALKGYRETGSSTLLRLTFAFFLLFLGFSISGLARISQVGPTTVQMIPTLVVAAAAFQMMGYFFLAFSHMIGVRASRTMPMLFIPFIPMLTLDAVFKVLSTYFLFYGLLETIIAYMRTRKPATVAIASGLGMLAFGELMRISAFLYPPGDILLVVSVGMRVFGLVTLLIPVLKFFAYQDVRRIANV
ncbi:MAG: hypothetical protein HY619_03590 [Thaumarchaeota archaeon]|nr:hypothetical protein [Nitrososphaerota archaeon]